MREFALSLPEAREEFPWSESVAKAGSKVFVFLGSPDATRNRAITVKLVESHAHALAIEGAEPTGYGLGRSGWVNVPIGARGVTIALLRDLVEESYRIVAPRRLVAELDGAHRRTAGAPSHRRLHGEGGRKLRADGRGRAGDHA